MGKGSKENSKSSSKGSKVTSKNASSQSGPEDQIPRDQHPTPKKRFKVSQRKSNISHIVLEEEDEDELLNLLVQLEILDGNDAPDESSCCDLKVASSDEADHVEKITEDIQFGRVSDSDEKSDSESDQSEGSNDGSSDIGVLTDGLKRKMVRKLIRDDRRIQAENALEKSIARSEMKSKKAEQFRASTNQAESPAPERKQRVDDTPLRVQISTEKNKTKTKVLVIDRSIGTSGIIKMCRDKLQANKRMGLLRVLPGGEEVDDDVLLSLRNDVHLCLCSGSPSSGEAAPAQATPEITVNAAAEALALSYSMQCARKCEGSVANAEETCAEPPAPGETCAPEVEEEVEGIAREESDPLHENEEGVAAGCSGDAILGAKAPDEAASAVMRADRSRTESSDAYTASILPGRESLPMYSASQDLLHMLDRNNAMIVVGDTGCGKVG
jgi:hypothetical protein